MSENGLLGQAKSELRAQGSILGGFVALFWLLELVDWIFLRGAMDRFGVRPRTLAGLWGILFGPFLHAGFGHLVANTVPFIVLGWFSVLLRMRF